MQVVANDPLLLPQLARHARPKMATQEVKALLAFPKIDHTGLVRVQFQTKVGQHRTCLLLGLPSLDRRPAKHHEVIRVTDQLPGAVLSPGPVESVQVDVQAGLTPVGLIQLAGRNMGRTTWASSSSGRRC